MIRVDGQEIFVIDGHMHFWDGSPENWRNKYGEGWMLCFYDYHKALAQPITSGPSRNTANTMRRR